MNGDELLFISITPVSESFPNAKIMMEFELSSSEQHEDFKLLERSVVTIAEIDAERIIYSYWGYHSTMESSAETGTAYKAYFDSEGHIWKIIMLADEYAAAERAEADFDHLLQTFRILD